MSPGRVAIIGDLAGHRAELEAELARLGAAADGRLPDDLIVVQVGDLVHRGPDSDGVVALVGRYLHEQPDRWVQLVGNHEAQYLADPAFEWPEHIGDDAAAALAHWWDSGTMRPAAAVRTGAGEALVITHAGLTHGFWEQALDAQPDAALAVRALNSFAGSHDDVVFRPGQMLGGGRPDVTAGPIWAAASTELAASWLGTDLPFSQVHGHSMVVDWRRRTINSTPEIARLVTVDEHAAHETITLPGGRIVGVDPGHGKKARTPWRAFVLDDATVVA